MSQPYDGEGMDYPLRSGSVKKARERAKLGLPRNPMPSNQQEEMTDDVPPGSLSAPPRRQLAAPPYAIGQSRLPRPKAPAALDGSNGNISQIISRPMQAPQWPLTGAPIPVNSSEQEPYRPPPGRPQQPPQRPPRPSQVPSILDQSHLQDPIPVFSNPQIIPEDDHVDYSSSVPPTPSSRMTTSTIGSIPDFPLATPTNGHSRRSANLGPPPSSRRGASSFYSNASYVSPIPEESSRSHGSYASSAAMPDSWPGGSPEGSPTFYEDTDTEKSRDSIYDDFGDESKLVRSASIGKRGKPALVNTRSPTSADPAQRPAPSPVQPFESGTCYIDTSTNSSNTLPMARPRTGDDVKDRLTPDAILGAFAAASATDPRESRLESPSPQPFSRLSAIRRPPKLDIDAVRDMEARGSMTSLPDLIRRATKLASMIDRGKRPASRFENFNDYLDEKDPRTGSKDISGLSDMLSAFPPPGQLQNDRQSRGSWFRTTSWPLAPSRQDGTHSRSTRRGMTPSDDAQRQQRRRCCGLPIWAFLIVFLLIICIIVAAILVPLQFFVFKNWGNHGTSQSELSQCQTSLDCKNGGTNVIAQGVCSCICTNAFTGSDCSVSGSDGCTTTNLTSLDGQNALNNVTIGNAIPRLIEGGNANFTIPLDGTAIMAKLNTENLSCMMQNSLVTLDGHSTRVGEASSKVETKEETLEVAGKKREETASMSVITVSQVAASTMLLVDEGTPSAFPTDDLTAPATTPTATKTTGNDNGASITPAPSSEPTADFVVTEEVLDFARVAVLYILQTETCENAETARTKLDRFFTDAGSKKGVTKTAAASLQIGDNNSINLVAFSLNIGRGAIGGKTKREIVADFIPKPRRRQVQQAARHGGSVLAKD